MNVLSFYDPVGASRCQEHIDFKLKRNTPIFLASSNLDLHICGPKEATEVPRFFAYGGGHASRE
jgi:hypothetical protein